MDKALTKLLHQLHLLPAFSKFKIINCFLKLEFLVHYNY